MISQLLRYGQYRKDHYSQNSLISIQANRYKIAVIYFFTTVFNKMKTGVFLKYSRGVI